MTSPVMGYNILNQFYHKFIVLSSFWIRGQRTKTEKLDDFMHIISYSKWEECTAAMSNKNFIYKAAKIKQNKMDIHLAKKKKLIRH